jgi:hypothetical protein
MQKQKVNAGTSKTGKQNTSVALNEDSKNAEYND